MHLSEIKPVILSH